MVCHFNQYYRYTILATLKQAPGWFPYFQSPSRPLCTLTSSRCFILLPSPHQGLTALVLSPPSCSTQRSLTVAPLHHFYSQFAAALQPRTHTSPAHSPPHTSGAAEDASQTKNRPEEELGFRCKNTRVGMWAWRSTELEMSTGELPAWSLKSWKKMSSPRRNKNRKHSSAYPQLL